MHRLAKAWLWGLLSVYVSGSSVPMRYQVLPKSIAAAVNWTDSRESQQQQAKAWLAEVAAIERQIPTLSPDESKWLKVEYDRLHKEQREG